MSAEFDLIRAHFAALGAARADVTLAVGDDCALVRVPQRHELALSIDTLVAGVHFFPDTDPSGLGHKSLAVGLSDLAAMGAEPAWATLALTLPAQLASDAAWLTAFASGLCELAGHHGVSLIGGDTTGGPLSISIQVHGFVPLGEAVRRGGAQPGDLIYVSGTLGDAGLALRRLQGGVEPEASLRRRLERPEPRVQLGLGLRKLATAMIDLSDGLAADLGHILAAGGIGAEISLNALPMSAAVAAVVADTGDWALPLSSGDDYELCFTLPSARQSQAEGLAAQVGVPIRSIGRITDGDGLVCRDADGQRWEPHGTAGFDHFAAQ